MEFDDPEIPEFANWDSYSKFAQQVRHGRRFVWEKSVTSFLDTVRETHRERCFKLIKGNTLYRAQRGVDFEESADGFGGDPIGFGRERMKPLVNRVTEGRSNASGMPVLYLGTTVQNVISEVRPWVGSYVSVARLKILKDLRAIDLSKGHGRSSARELLSHIGPTHKTLNADRKRLIVWSGIDDAFSRPVTLSDNYADYAPTQILAELFKDCGYEAIVYKSQFGEQGFNVVLFNVDDAEVIDCTPFLVKGVEVKFENKGTVVIDE